MSKNVTYKGTRGADGKLVVWRVEGSSEGRLRHIPAHSAEGFDCGDGEAGSSNLALALASDVIGPEEETVPVGSGQDPDGSTYRGTHAWEVHECVRERVVEKLPKDQPEWLITANTVMNAIEACGQENAEVEELVESETGSEEEAVGEL